MYERLLDKDAPPTRRDMERTMGAAAAGRWKKLESFLLKSYELKAEIRFPFGKSYGWGIKYSHRSAHLFYLFPESGAFTATIRLGDPGATGLRDKLPSLLTKTRELWDARYPCGDGGWVHYRVLSARELDDVIELVKLRKKPA